MRNNKLSIILVAILFATIISGGCGGSSHGGSSNSRRGENVILLDALLEGSIVEVDFVWDNQNRTLVFQNSGKELFQNITPESDDLSFSMTCLQDDILSLELCNPQYSDEWIKMSFNCSEEKYTIEFSPLINQMFYHLYGFYAIRVNGVDLTNAIENVQVEKEENEDTATLKDIENNGATVALNVFLNNVFYHVIFRNVDGTFELIDGNEEEFQLVTMSKADGEWLNVLFEVSDSIWMSIRYYYADNTYEVNVSEGYSGKMENISINGVEITSDLTWRFNWDAPNGRPARLEDVLQKNAQVIIYIAWDDEFKWLVYRNTDGNNNFDYKYDTDVFSSTELSANEENMVFTIISKNNSDIWMRVTIEYVSGTYHVDYSPMISEEQKSMFGFFGISVNSTDLTDALVEM